VGVRSGQMSIILTFSEHTSPKSTSRASYSRLESTTYVLQPFHVAIDEFESRQRHSCYLSMHSSRTRTFVNSKLSTSEPRSLIGMSFLLYSRRKRDRLGAGSVVEGRQIGNAVLAWVAVRKYIEGNFLPKACCDLYSKICLKKR